MLARLGPARTCLLACRWQPCHRVLTGPPQSWCMGKISFSSSSYKATSHIGVGPHPVTSFNLNYLLKTLSLQTVTLGAGASTYECAGRGEHSAVHSISFHISPPCPRNTTTLVSILHAFQYEKIILE